MILDPLVQLTDQRSPGTGEAPEGVLHPQDRSTVRGSSGDVLSDQLGVVLREMASQEVGADRANEQGDDEDGA